MAAANSARPIMADSRSQRRKERGLSPVHGN
jgi:hypothetical protein